MHLRTPALALAAAAVLLLSTGCNDAEPTAAHPRGGKHHAGNTHQGDAAGGSDPGASSSSDAPSDGGTSETTTVPVYYVGDSPQGPRLFREFRRAPAGDPLQGAADLLTQGDPLDPDYRTLFPVGSLGQVSWSDGAGAIVVQLTDDSLIARPAGMSRRTAVLATQQLVYTLQGVQQARVPVLVQQGADAVPLLGVDTTAGLTEADYATTLNLVSVTSPEEGAVVGDQFTASGVASSFEATVGWEIRQGDAVVLRASTTGEGWMGHLYPWKTSIDVSTLAPGQYTFVALTDDPTGGEGGGPQSDSKDITVS